MSKSRSGWILYIMIHFPIIVFFKVGITSARIGAKGRAKAIDREMPGIPIPIFFVPIPGAYYVEQALHRMMGFSNVRFYRKDGSSEWFLLAPLFIALPVMLMIWGLWVGVMDSIFGTNMLPVLSEGVFYTIFKLLTAFQQ